MAVSDIVIKTDFHVRSFVAAKDTDWADSGFHQHRTLEISILLEGRECSDGVEAS